MRRGFPLAYPGMRIGLLGGTFDPAHEGHAHVAHVAKTRLGLDQVWWLVTPQNPLKPKTTPLKERVASARRLSARGDIVTDIETRLSLQYTADVLTALKRRYPGVQFVWVMGADNLETLDRWRRWRAIFRSVPIAIVSRPSARAKTRFSGPVRQFAAARRPTPSACALPAAHAPAWVFLPARYSQANSTALRAARSR
ncbi:MAG: nicotinate-nucleotide adenylyltransferase [Hyphomonadaceae bacterium]